MKIVMIAGIVVWVIGCAASGGGHPSPFKRKRFAWPPMRKNSEWKPFMKTYMLN